MHPPQVQFLPITISPPYRPYDKGGGGFSYTHLKERSENVFLGAIYMYKRGHSSDRLVLTYLFLLVCVSALNYVWRREWE